MGVQNAASFFCVQILLCTFIPLLLPALLKFTGDPLKEGEGGGQPAKGNNRVSPQLEQRDGSAASTDRPSPRVTRGRHHRSPKLRSARPCGRGTDDVPFLRALYSLYTAPVTKFFLNIVSSESLLL